MWEAMHVWGQEVYGKFVVLPLNFALNVKLLPKNKVLYEKAHSLKNSVAFPVVLI